MQMRRYGFSFNKICQIFISHVHGDHLFGLFGLLSTLSLLGRTKQLSIYAPAGFADILECYLKHFGTSFLYPVVHTELKGNEQSVIYSTRTLEVLSFPLNHRIDCYGFLFREKSPRKNVYKHLIEEYKLSIREIARLKEGEDIDRGQGEILLNSMFTYKPYIPRSFAYCSDTAPFAQLSTIVSGVDLLYHEATFANDQLLMARDTLHSTAADAARCAADAGVKKLLLGHMSSRYKDYLTILQEAKEIFPETEIAQQGEEYIIAIEKPLKQQ